MLPVTSLPVVDMEMNESENAELFTSLRRCLGHVPPGGHPREDLGHYVSHLAPGPKMMSTKATTNLVLVSLFPPMLN